MTEKRVADLVRGDKLRISDPNGVARITSVNRATWIRHADGPAYDIQFVIIEGPQKGEKGWHIAGPNDMAILAA